MLRQVVGSRHDVQEESKAMARARRIGGRGFRISELELELATAAPDEARLEVAAGPHFTQRAPSARIFFKSAQSLRNRRHCFCPRDTLPLLRLPYL